LHLAQVSLLLGLCHDLTIRRDRPEHVAAWRATLSDTSRYRLTSAMRQTLAAAVRWRYIARNPAVDA
jgi:hypothetical protein